MSDLRQSPERQRLLDATSEIAAELDAGGAEAEKLRHLPPKSVDLLLEADLFRCAAPREVGGLEVDPVTQLEIFEAVTAAETSAGWNLAVGAIWDLWLGARLPDAGARTVFNGDSWPITAGLVWPFGQAHVIEDGGYKVRGRWRFASGINQAAWIASGCTLVDSDDQNSREGAQPTRITAVVPKTDVEVLDTWHVSGLRGTGSTDYVIDDLEVSHDFVLLSDEYSHLRGGAWCGLPGPFQAAPGHSGFALGVARRCLDEVKALGDKQRYLNPSTQAGRESVQMEVGRLMVEYEASRLFTIEYLKDNLSRAQQGLPPVQKPAIRYTTEIAIRCAQFAFQTLGTEALFEEHPVQRFLRDILAAVQHVGAADSAFARYGKTALTTDQ